MDTLWSSVSLGSYGVHRELETVNGKKMMLKAKLDENLIADIF